ncbi:glycosyltransferase family 61 protein [Leptolyngbya sp. AN02str]|uniref:glycosyltransferase family 61 protein n=1 Tax=Leptolyngbya sp. AN02str TaxID=3423363 RepID=UPI003D31DE54
MVSHPFVKRLIHSTKVSGGAVVSKFLRSLFLREQGSAARLRQAFVQPQHWEGCSVQKLLPAVDSPTVEPKFFVSNLRTQAYLELLKNGETTTSTAGIVALNEVNVLLPTGLHLWQGKVFSDLLIGTELLINPKYVLQLESIPFQKKHEAPEAVLLTLPWNHNFFHWMIEILPRLVLYDMAKELHHLKLIVPKSSSKFVKDSLRITGYSDRVSFLEDGVYRFEKLHGLSRLAKTSYVSSYAVEWWNQKVPPVPAAPSRRIYVSRADSKIRYLTNEREVETLLAKFGFETVVMSQYSLEEQIRMFQQSAVVIGAHGSAFTHTAFMAPGTRFIEFFEDGHFNRCFHRIASLKGLQYGFLVGQKQGFGFAIDLAQLQELLKQVLD